MILLAADEERKRSWIVDVAVLDLAVYGPPVNRIITGEGVSIRRLEHRTLEHVKSVPYRR